MKMRTLLAFAAVAVLLVSSSSYGYINWYNTAAGLITYADGSTPLAGSMSDNTVGCFAQLVYAGANGTIDAAVLSGDGTSGDDAVVSTGWFGQGVFGGPAGYMSASQDAYVEDGNYYVRAWTAPSADFGAGSVPTASSNFYGNSSLLNYTKPIPDDNVETAFDFGDTTGFSCTMQVPEPSFVALAFIGLLTIRLVRRKKA